MPKKGYKQTKEHREKLRKIGFKRRHSKETKAKISKSHIGIKHTEETKRKLSENRKGNKHWNWGKKHSKKTIQKIKQSNKKYWREHSNLRKGKNNNFYNKHHTERTKKILKIKMKNRFVGQRNPNYTNGLSNEPYPLEFNKSLKELIRNRDNRKCQLCGCPEVECLRKLDIHHIDYDKENLDPKNLISLCNKCNSKANANRKYWKKYYQNKIMKRYNRWTKKNSL